VSVRLLKAYAWQTRTVTWASGDRRIKIIQKGADFAFAEGGPHRDPLGWDDPLRQLVREIETFRGP
jgi:hypothetical protein